MSQISLDNTMGAAFIGVVAASWLHGVSCVQAWHYFTHPSEKDRWHIKYLVSAVMLFDTIHQALISHTVYTYLVSNYNAPASLNRVVWSLLVEVLFNGFTAFLVQGFLTVRVWRLSHHNIWITAIVTCLVIAEFGCVIAFTILALVRDHTFVELAKLKALSITVNALAVAGDVLIALTLCLLLNNARTKFSRSNTMIKKLIAFSVGTGALTSLCAVASLISISVAPNTFVYITFFFCIGRFYANSLLVTLNGRKRIRDAAEGINSTDTPSFNLNELHHKSMFSPKRLKHEPTNISIKIDTIQESATDASPIKTKPTDRNSVSFPDKDDSLSGSQVSFSVDTV